MSVVIVDRDFLNWLANQSERVGSLFSLIHGFVEQQIQYMLAPIFMHLSVDNSLCLFFYAILDNADSLAILIIVFLAAYALEYSRDKIFQAFHEVFFRISYGRVNLSVLERKFNACMYKYTFRVVAFLMYWLF